MIQTQFNLILIFSLLTKQIDSDLSKKFVKQGATHDMETGKTEKDKSQPSKIDATEPQVISKQAAQNIGIFLRSSKFSSEQIKRMIISMDDALTEQVLVLYSRTSLVQTPGDRQNAF